MSAWTTDSLRLTQTQSESSTVEAKDNDKWANIPFKGKFGTLQKQSLVEANLGEAIAVVCATGGVTKRASDVPLSPRNSKI